MHLTDTVPVHTQSDGQIADGKDHVSPGRARSTPCLRLHCQRLIPPERGALIQHLPRRRFSDEAHFAQEPVLLRWSLARVAPRFRAEIGETGEGICMDGDS
eukprot:2701131-Pleurochrysis_carterae.AAC.1